VSVTWDDLTSLKGGPNVLSNFIIRCVFTDLRSHLLGPSEDFLVRETAQSQLHPRARTAEAHPCKGPARPFKAAEYDRKGSDSADPTK